MKNQLYMRDFLTFRVTSSDPAKKFLHECKDSTSETGSSLLVHVDATHSGVVNGNFRFYRPDLQQDSTHTWGNNKRTKKPILVHHDRESDPLGRVASWKYVDLRHEYVGKYGEVNNLLFYDAVSRKKMDLHRSIRWVVDTLQTKNKDFVGLGKIQLGLNVTNPEAIGKVQRGEYATVSVGFKTDAAICSICHQDWAEDGQCEHKPGKVYEDSRAFLVAGNFDYQEVSFVTFPADKAAVVLGAEAITQAKDSLSFRAFLLGQDYETNSRLIDSGVSTLEFTDMLASDIEVVTDAEQDNEMELDAIRKEINGKDLTKERAFELQTELANHTDAKRLVSSLQAKIRKNGWDVEEAPVLTKEAVEIRIAGLDAHLASLSDSDKETYLAQLETDATAFGLTVPKVEGGELLDGGFVDTEKSLSGTDQVLSALKSEGLVFSDSAEGKTFVEYIEKASAAYVKLPDEEKYTGLRLIYQTYDILGDNQMLESMKARLQATPEQSQGIYDKKEVEDLQDAVASFTKENQDLKKAQATTLGSNAILFADLKKSLATNLVMYSVLSKEPGFVGLDAAQINTKITERAKRQLVSLKDSLKDLSDKLGAGFPEPAEDQEQKAPEAATAEAKAIEDTAAVQDSADQPTEGLEGTDAAEAHRGTGSAPRAIVTSLAQLRELRKRGAVDRYRSLKEKVSE